MPPVKTRVILECEASRKEGYVKEGYAFSPMFTLGYKAVLKAGEGVTTWLRLEKAD